MTKRLYDTDSSLTEFEAHIISVRECEDEKIKKKAPKNAAHIYEIILDESAFFPEGGGQRSDYGTAVIGSESGEEISATVFDVQQINDEVIHYVSSDAALPAATRFAGSVDKAHRMHVLCHHSGEHISSGLARSMFGAENIGFHLNEEFATFDFNLALTKEQILALESEANKAVRANAAITIFYPSAEELKSLEYRSKIEFSEDAQVRIVNVEGYDICACCAPHVKSTGEIGLIKFINTESIRGGTRITMLAGEKAFSYISGIYEQARSISSMLSAKPLQISEAVRKSLEESLAKEQKINELMQLLVSIRLENMISAVHARLKDTSKNPDKVQVINYFEAHLNHTALRDLINKTIDVLKNAGILKCLVFGFIGSDEEGYTYICGSYGINLKEKGNYINEGLKAKGGGSAAMITGKSAASRNEIDEFLATL